MADAWVLALDPPSSDPQKKLGGLPLCLRLVLDAQAAGAQAVLVPDPALFTLVKQLIAERAASGRGTPVTIPLCSEPPEGATRVSVPANFVVPRELLKALGPHGDVDLARAHVPIQTPYGFQPRAVDDPGSLRLAERALFRSLRKTQDGWTSRHLNRYISLPISRLLAKTPLSPNQISVVVLFIGLFGAWLAAHGDYASCAAGAFLFQAQSVLDGCDGELSRVTYRGSRLGEWLDTIGDDLTNYAFFGATAWGLFTKSADSRWLAIGSLGVLAGIAASAIEYRYLVRIGSGDLLRYPLSPESASDKQSAFEMIRPLFKRDTFVLLSLLAALGGVIGVMLIAFAIGALAVLVSVILAELRMARERRPRATELR